MWQMPVTHASCSFWSSLKFFNCRLPKGRCSAMTQNLFTFLSHRPVFVRLSLHIRTKAHWASAYCWLQSADYHNAYSLNAEYHNAYPLNADSRNAHYHNADSPCIAIIAWCRSHASGIPGQYGASVSWKALLSIILKQRKWFLFLIIFLFLFTRASLFLSLSLSLTAAVSHSSLLMASSSQLPVID